MSMHLFCLVLTLFLVGCAEFQNPYGPFGNLEYHGGATAYGRGEVPVPRQLPVSARGASLPSVKVARFQTGTSYQDGMARLRTWNGVERERELDAYLARHPEFGSATRQARIDLKAALARWDTTLANRRDLVTRIGGSFSSDSRYNQLLQGRAKTQARLDEIDAAIVTAMLEENAGIAARSMSWTAEKARTLDMVARNAQAAEAAERAKTDASFSKAIF